MHHTLNNIGQGLPYDAYDEIDMSVLGRSGRGFVGAEGYTYHRPRPRVRYDD